MRVNKPERQKARKSAAELVSKSQKVIDLDSLPEVKSTRVEKSVRKLLTW